MVRVIYDRDGHRCVVFYNIFSDEREDVQTNQFLIIHGNEGLLFDPGGTKVFDVLYKRVSEFINPLRVRSIILSHQDPDAGAAVNSWLTISQARVYMPSVWLRFVPHFVRTSRLSNYYVAIPDKGMKFDLNGAELVFLPAHFLHSPGNIHLYDTASRILFSGDMGTSVIPDAGDFSEVTDFEGHIKYMEGFHKRYLASNKVCRLWANMVRRLDVEMIIPQHGLRYFRGKSMVSKFIDWINNLQCGVDLLDQSDYILPV